MIIVFSCGYFIFWVIKLDSFVKVLLGVNEIGFIVELSVIVGMNFDDCFCVVLCFVRLI